MIKNIIFDIGGVILDYNRETYLAPFGFDKETEKFILKNVIFTPNWTRLLKGEITNAEFVFDAGQNHPQYKDVVKEFFEPQNMKTMLPPFKETLNFIKELKNDGYKLFVISDMEENTISYIKSEIDGFEDLFDGLIFSSRVHMVKKDGAIFDFALNQFNIKAEETLFVDDAERNLEQARKRNILTFQFVSPTDSIPQIKNLIKQV